ncbi:MAG TPA: hypothetical protein VGS16_14635 [Candidatus Dormibacteraeota bacterium]|nr:hypothetical protein [Candidatus Dormibacteraeota bacterium]
MSAELKSLTRLSKRFSADELFLWVACVLTAAGGVIALVAPAGGTNRLSGVALPFAVSAGAQAANALIQRRSGWLSGLLYAVAVVAILYGVLLALSVPFRLTIEGTCQPAPAACPLGFEVPITAGEKVAEYAAVIGGFVALLINFVAAELRFRPRRSRTPVPARSEKSL